MSDLEKASAAKAKGNQHFAKGEFKESIDAYSEAIALNPKEHTLYSNRSGSYASLGQYDKALEDGEKCIELAPNFIKGYLRKGLALFNLNKLAEAKACYEAGLKVDPNDEKLKEALEETQNKERGAKNPMASLFGDNMWAKLQLDPTTREYLKDPAFVAKMQLLQKSPNMLNAFSGDRDPRMMQAIGVILGLGSQGFRTAPGGDGGDDSAPMDTETEPEPQPKTKKSKADEDSVEVKEETEDQEEEEEEPKPKPTKKPEPKPQEKKKEQSKPELSPEEQEAKKKQQEAIKEKDEGNNLYKQRKFEEALVHYNKAAELDPTNMIYTTNAAAVLFETKQYDKCIEVCRKSIEIGQENKADGKTLAKAWLRLGNAYAKQDKLQEAINAYNKGLIEEYNDPLKTALKKTEALKKKRDELAYIDPVKAEEHKKKGNEYYEQAKWKEAIDEYTEALHRDPKNYKIYSNRAACFTKLMDWGRALEDCETCLKLEPKFVKIFIRKANIQFYLKNYYKALETYTKGLEIDPECSELVEGKRQVLEKINDENSSGQVDPARRAEALKDPEIQAILRDPTINKVLSDMQSDPSSAQGALRDPSIMAKLEKLIAAGVLQAKPA